MKEYWDKLKLLFLDNSKFFQKIANEKNYWVVLKFFVVFYMITTIIQILLSISKILGLVDSSLLLRYGLGYLVIGIILAFIFPFISSALAHAGVWLFGGRKGYFNTFKPATYGGVVMLIYSVTGNVITWISRFSNPILAKILIIFAGIIVIAGVVHMLIVQAKGVAKFQNISKVKAFFGIILIPLILLIITIILFLIISTWVTGITLGGGLV